MVEEFNSAKKNSRYSDSWVVLDSFFLCHPEILILLSLAFRWVTKKIGFYFCNLSCCTALKKTKSLTKALIPSWWVNESLNPMLTELVNLVCC